MQLFSLSNPILYIIFFSLYYVQSSKYVFLFQQTLKSCNRNVLRRRVSPPLSVNPYPYAEDNRRLRLVWVSRYSRETMATRQLVNTRFSFQFTLRCSAPATAGYIKLGRLISVQTHRVIGVWIKTHLLSYNLSGFIDW